jgi:hypothetical protein
MATSTWRLLLRPAFDAETEASCGTSVAEAREALAFWRGRLMRLPWYRRSARAEARVMAARWQRRVIEAELERWRLGAVSRLVLPVVERWAPRGVRATHLARIAVRRTRLGRLLAVIAVAAVVTAVAVVALAAVAVAQVL